MGHQHHFLSRLDRLALPHVELALSLYRDDELLRYILAQARVPEGAERVALSLDDPERGPFLVVARSGHFVTCLAEGMSPGDLPIVPRGKLDAICARGGDQRARIAVARGLIGPSGGAGKLIKRIYEAGDELSREELIGVSALLPVFGFELFRFLLAAAVDLTAARDTLVKEMRRSDRLKPAFHDVARLYWRTFWAIGHLSVLTAMGGPELFDRLPAEISEHVANTSFSWGCVRQGVLSLALRGTWAAARLGKTLLPAYKRNLREASTILTFYDSAMGLMALGTRHARLQAEVKKALTTGPALDASSPRGDLLQKLGNLAEAVFDTGVDEAQLASLDCVQQALGSKRWMLGSQHLPGGHPLRFERPEDVPADLAMTLAVNMEVSFLGDVSGDVALLLLGMVPWVARSTPEALYLPREAVRVLHEPWTPAVTHRLLRAMRDHYRPTQGAVVRSGPTRNGPCPCGSGKKHKRCCGADASG